jgi:hypothetical protein
MCQGINRIQKKQNEKSDLLIGGSGLSSIVICVIRNVRRSNHIIIKARNTFAPESAKVSIIKQSLFGKIRITKELENKGNLNGFTQQDIENHIQREFHILKQEDTHDKKMQRGVIPLKNGKNLKANLVINVLSANLRNHLRKTILNHYQKVEQIIYQTSSHYAVVAIAASGRSFNIYENPELLEDKNA